VAAAPLVVWLVRRHKRRMAMKQTMKSVLKRSLTRTRSRIGVTAGWEAQDDAVLLSGVGQGSADAADDDGELRPERLISLGGLISTCVLAGLAVCTLPCLLFRKRCSHRRLVSDAQQGATDVTAGGGVAADVATLSRVAPSSREPAASEASAGTDTAAIVPAAATLAALASLLPPPPVAEPAVSQACAELVSCGSAAAEGDARKGVELTPPATDAAAVAAVADIPADERHAPEAPVPGGSKKTIREGSRLEAIVNSLESASGVDLDGDGDVGLPGHHAPALVSAAACVLSPPTSAGTAAAPSTDPPYVGGGEPKPAPGTVPPTEQMLSSWPEIQRFEAPALPPSDTGSVASSSVPAATWAPLPPSEAGSAATSVARVPLPPSDAGSVASSANRAEPA